MLFLIGCNFCYARYEQIIGVLEKKIFGNFLYSKTDVRSPSSSLLNMYAITTRKGLVTLLL